MTWKTIWIPLLLLSLSTAAADVTPPVAKLATARVEAAAAVYALVEMQFTNGTTTLDAVYTWSVRWYQSERDAGNPKAAVAHLLRMEKLASNVKLRTSTGVAPHSDELAVTYYRAEAQLWAARK
jgi:hypothetical protein